jgi:hypothetical protein
VHKVEKMSETFRRLVCKSSKTFEARAQAD